LGCRVKKGGNKKIDGKSTGRSVMSSVDGDGDAFQSQLGSFEGSTSSEKVSQQTVMELYEQLASNEEEERIKAAKQLVRRVVEGGKSGQVEKGVDSEYALNRLIKGLSSGRESARLGFSIALTEVSSQSGC
jgi:hypothetical protein